MIYYRVKPWLRYLKVATHRSHPRVHGRSNKGFFVLLKRTTLRSPLPSLSFLSISTPFPWPGLELGNATPIRNQHRKQAFSTTRSLIWQKFGISSRISNSCTNFKLLESSFYTQYIIIQILLWHRTVADDFWKSIVVTYPFFSFSHWLLLLFFRMSNADWNSWHNFQKLISCRTQRKDYETTYILNST